MSGNYDFTIYKSNKLENEKFLRKALSIIKELAEKAPLKKKSIVVQSDGMARWLTLKAATDAGVFANFEFVSPDVFLRNFAEKYFGIAADSVYNKKDAEWALYSLLRNEKSGPAGRYIGENEARAFRFCRTFADMIEQYFVYRPNMMKLWQEGKKSGSDYDESWQFDIFRRLYEKENAGKRSFSQLFKEKCANAAENAGYPDALVLFGISIMNKYQLDMFRELSRLFPVHLFTMSPSREYFSLSKKKGAFGSEEKDELSAEDLPDTFFGRFCAAGLDFLNFTSDLNDECDFETPEGKRLLNSIQRDILNDSEIPEKIENDDSVRIVSCRDKMREIEVLKDNLLEIFKENTGLKPEDVAVMAPRINDYVPYITAVFGGTDPNDRTFIPWVISDRTFSGESRIAAAFLEILRLGNSNYEKSKVFSIFRTPCVCAKFGVDEKALDSIEKLVDESGVRWGLDADSRGGNSGDSRLNTWDFGLSRIMMSQIMPFSENGETFEGILPLETVSKEDFGNVSCFVTFAKELFRYSKMLSSAEKTPAEFKNLLEEMLDFFFACDQSNGSAKEEVRHIRKVIDDFAETAGKFSGTLSFDALLQYLEDELGRERSGRGFLSAKVNFCSLKPLRALPFKVICLIGMGDGEFPRSENRYAFDLTQKKEPGASVPRSVRDNDKYLFVEAVVSAREKLLISYEAKNFSEDSKKHRRAAMPVQILKKYIEAKTGVEADELETKYPLQPFSAEYFKEDAPFKTFSGRDFKLAHAMFHVEQNAPDPAAKRVSEQETETNADLEKLASFFKDPIKFYLTQTLKIVLPDDSGETGDEELFDYSGDNLLAYNIRKIYVDMAEAAEEPGDLEDAFIRRIKNEGRIPFGAFGEAELRGFAADSNLRVLAGKIAGKDFDFEDISLDFEDLSLKLQGRIKNIERPDRMILVSPVKCREKYQFEALVRHLAANAAGINVSTSLCFIDKTFTLAKLDENDAKRDLAPFLKLWKFGKRHLPLFDPELIAKAAGRTAGDVPAAVTSFFEEKWLKKNDGHTFLSQEFLVAAEQFLQRKEHFLSEFPAAEVLETGGIWKKFYLSAKDRNSR